MAGVKAAIVSLSEAVNASKLRTLTVTVSKDQSGKSTVKINATTEVAREGRVIASLPLEGSDTDVHKAIAQVLGGANDHAAISVNLAKSLD
jgi:Mrp family chromosome partitioning ATPase